MKIVCRRLDAAIDNPENPRRFRVLPKWKKAMEGFSHGQLAAELLFNMMLDRPAALVVLSKPTLQVPGDDLIERPSLRTATGIPLLWTPAATRRVTYAGLDA